MNEIIVTASIQTSRYPSIQMHVRRLIFYCLLMCSAQLAVILIVKILRILHKEGLFETVSIPRSE